jgi:hypothetical protein
MIIRVLVLVMIAFVGCAVPAISSAQPWRRGIQDSYERPPYGQFCPGMRGDPYGGRNPVATTEEAKQALEKYFDATGKKVSIGRIEERRWFFFAETLDPEGNVVDKAVIDKRTGRIRSIY